MHDALQPRPHLPQFMHLLSSICKRNIEKRLKKLSNVPTGQMVLQYSRPHIHAQTHMIMSVSSPVISRGSVTEPDAVATMDWTIRPYALYGAISAISIWLLTNNETIESTKTP